jgi:hypothetical protein
MLDAVGRGCVETEVMHLKRLLPMLVGLLAVTPAIRLAGIVNGRRRVPRVRAWRGPHRFLPHRKHRLLG